MKIKKILKPWNVFITELSDYNRYNEPENKNITIAEKLKKN